MTELDDAAAIPKLEEQDLRRCRGIYGYEPIEVSQKVKPATGELVVLLVAEVCRHGGEVILVGKVRHEAEILLSLSRGRRGLRRRR